jgi:ATP-dependent protease HslVU (ClpYQ) peptidase subunit
MSVLACRVTSNTIYIAADTQVTKGDCRVLGLKYHKLLRIGEIVIGFAGRCDEAEIFCNFIKNNSLPCTCPGDIILFMSEFYKFRDGLSESLKPKPDECASPCSYIIIVRGRVFLIGDMSCFELNDGYFATGSGEGYAVGAMAYGAGVEDAVKIACKHDVYCSEPIDYFEIDRKGEE